MAAAEILSAVAWSTVVLAFAVLLVSCAAVIFATAVAIWRGRWAKGHVQGNPVESQFTGWFEVGPANEDL